MHSALLEEAARREGLPGRGSEVGKFWGSGEGVGGGLNFSHARHCAPGHYHGLSGHFVLLATNCQTVETDGSLLLQLGDGVGAQVARACHRNCVSLFSLSPSFFLSFSLSLFLSPSLSLSLFLFISLPLKRRDSWNSVISTENICGLVWADVDAYHSVSHS